MKTKGKNLRALAGLMTVFSLLLCSFLLAIERPARAATSVTFTLKTVADIDYTFQYERKKLLDVDGDGLEDIVADSADEQDIYWWRAPNFTTRYKMADTHTGGCDITYGDVDNDGDIDVIQPLQSPYRVIWLENPSAGGGDPTQTWTSHQIATYSEWLKEMETADFDGDGKLDVVYRTEAVLAILFQDTPTSFTKVTISNRGHEGLDVGPINSGDSYIDIAIAGYWYQSPGGSSARTAGNWTERAISGMYTGESRIKVGDIDEDGYMDIIRSHSEASGSVQWYENNGANPPSWTARTIDSSMAYVHALEFGDVNLDGYVDVVGMAFYKGSTPGVYVWYNTNGTGTSWDEQQVSSVQSYQGDIGDIDNDGDLDLLAAPVEDTNGTLKVYINKTTLSLDSWTYKQISSTNAPQGFGIAARDVTGDGYMDVVVTGSFYRNPGGNMTGTWTKTSLPSGMDALWMVDVDGDAYGDIIAQKDDSTTTGIYWLEATATDGSAWTQRCQVGDVPRGNHGTSEAYHIGQIEPGGKPEIVISSGSTTREINYFRIPTSSPESGSWPKVKVHGTTAGSGVAVGEINNDGYPDIFGTDGGTVYWFLNPTNGSSNWTRTQIGTIDASYTDRVLAADINGDGQTDVVVTEEATPTSKTFWWQNPGNGSGTWTRRTICTQDSTNSADAGDLDHDGDIDVVTGEHKGTNLYVKIWENNGANPPSWSAHTVSSGKETHLGTRLFDLDNDHDLDIVSGAWTTYQYVHLWRNDASARAPAPTPTPTSMPTNTPTPGGGPPTSGLAIWYKADAGVQTSSSYVTQWNDQSGNGINASQGTSSYRPLLVSNVINGLPVVRFDGSNDRLNFTKNINGWTGMTVVMVSANAVNPGCCTELCGAVLYWTYTGANTNMWFSSHQTNMPSHISLSSGQPPCYTRPSSIGSAFSRSMWVYSGSGGTLKTYVDGTLVQTNTGQPSSIASVSSSGSLGPAYTGYFNGDVAEILVYSQALSDSDRQALDSYLDAKY